MTCPRDDQADARDALCKEAYNKIFRWICNRINASIAAPEAKTKARCGLFVSPLLVVSQLSCWLLLQRLKLARENGGFAACAVQPPCSRPALPSHVLHCGLGLGAQSVDRAAVAIENAARNLHVEGVVWG
jgi:hypothetical protein